jgi:hypothetical protein
MITAEQAYALAESAIAHFTTASGLYTQMAVMATWTPEYEQMRDQARGEFSAGQADYASYQLWRDQQAETALRDRIAAAKPGYPVTTALRSTRSPEQVAGDLTTDEIRELEAADAADRRDDPMMREN